MKVVQVLIPFVLAPHQAKVRNAIVAGLKRFFVLVCGRRSGKTLGAVYMTVEYLTTHPNTIGWWVAPTFPLTRKGMRETVHFLRQGQKHLVAAVHRTERRIEFVNGSFLEFRSAHEPDSQLVSEGLDWLVVDEAALIGDPLIWSQYLRPALADRQGKALLITSPRGLNWLYEFWLRGQDATDSEVASWRYSTADCGFVTASELADIERTTPVRIWQQEYLAEFLGDGGEVFRNVTACRGPKGEPDEHTVIGVDLAYVRDFTVLWAMNSALEWVEVQRFQQLDWSVQKVRIVEMYRRLGAKRVLIDVTGILGQGAVAAELSRERVQVEPVNFTAENKRALVENLMTKFDQVAIRIPDDPVVSEEFRAFTYKAMPSGRDRYEASKGKHDDAVMACALAAWGQRHLAARPLPPKPEMPLQRMKREIVEGVLRGTNDDAWGN